MLKNGDTVRLKSGGPLMTVDDPNILVDDHCYCSWFDKEGVLHNDLFAAEALEKASKIPMERE